jgi:hypothetical protein
MEDFVEIFVRRGQSYRRYADAIQTVGHSLVDCAENIASALVLV